MRVLLKHQTTEQDYEAAAAARRICEVEGDGVVSERMVQRWFQRFNTGEENTKDLQHSERKKYGILRIYAEFWKRIRNKVLVGCQKYMKLG